MKNVSKVQKVIGPSVAVTRMIAPKLQGTKANIPKVQAPKLSIPAAPTMSAKAANSLPKVNNKASFGTPKKTK